MSRYGPDQLASITEGLDRGSGPGGPDDFSPPTSGGMATYTPPVTPTLFGQNGAFIYKATRATPAFVAPGTNPAENFDSSGILLDAIGGVPFSETINVKNAANVLSLHTAQVYVGGLLRGDMTTETTVSTIGGIAAGLSCDYIVINGTPGANVHLHFATVSSGHGFSIAAYDHLGNILGSGGGAGPVEDFNLFNFDATGYIAVMVTGEFAPTTTTYDFSVGTAIAPFTFTGIELPGGWLYEVRSELTLAFDGSQPKASGSSRLHVPLFITPPAGDPMDMDSVQSWALTDIPGGGSSTKLGDNLGVYVPVPQTARLSVVIEPSGPDPGTVYAWTAAAFSIQQLGNLTSV